MVSSEHLLGHGACVLTEEPPEARQAGSPDVEQAREENVAQFGRAVECGVPEKSQEERVLFVRVLAGVPCSPMSFKARLTDVQEATFRAATVARAR